MKEAQKARVSTSLGQATEPSLCEGSGWGRIAESLILDLGGDASPLYSTVARIFRTHRRPTRSASKNVRIPDVHWWQKKRPV